MGARTQESASHLYTETDLHLHSRTRFTSRNRSGRCLQQELLRITSILGRVRCSWSKLTANFLTIAYYRTPTDII
jgi:hypothetical protein